MVGAWQVRQTRINVLVLLLSFAFALLSAQQITHPSEVKALQAVRRRLSDPSKHLRSWKKKSDPCTSNWIGVICNTSNDGYLHVQELRLLELNLFGTLAPELGQLPNLQILDFLWNHISGSIPKEIGNISTLQLLLLSGNQISGPLPDELGFLPSLTKFQLDLNNISGSIPKSFANLPKVKHFHMNNNSFSGQIPPELSKLPLLQHVLLDNNKLSGYLPPELSQMPSLKILQLDNNDFSGSTIPDTYGNMSKLLKLSLRNCKLQGRVPDLSGIPGLLYLDLSNNQLTGNIPSNKLSSTITTILLSHNQLNGSIPYTSGFPRLQNLSLDNNLLSGSVPSTIWANITFSSDAKLLLDFQNNLLSDISGSLNPPSNVSIMLQGNPVCTNANARNIVPFCGPTNGESVVDGGMDNSSDICLRQSCPNGFEYVPESPVPCFCAAPFGVGVRLRSPSISDFLPYKSQFEAYLTSYFKFQLYQISVDSFIWEKGPRLKMFLKFFPQYSNVTQQFSTSDIQGIEGNFSTFAIPGNDTYGPYDLLNFTGGIYGSDIPVSSKSGTNKGVMAGIVLGAISCAIAVLLAIAFLVLKVLPRRQQSVLKDKSVQFSSIRVEGLRKLSFEELEMITSKFSITTQVGEGGYGKVYKGVLVDGTVVAIKRAQQGSLQGEKEFYTEIELLSRVHHRNLVSLIGYCDEKREQMLVYEFMPNGSLSSLLSERNKGNLSFGTRLDIALGAAKGILYLHTEADPPIIHRDIKANNILLDSKFTAKVSDFGISKLAPVPDGKGISADHISTVVKGTPGYVDPEYFLTRKLTEKSDVYSFGIVLLELLTGMQPIHHGRNIVREVNTACQTGQMFSIIDRRMGLYPSDSVKRFMALALRCCNDSMKVRPLMLEVVRELENICSTLPAESKQTGTGTGTGTGDDHDQPPQYPGLVSSCSGGMSSELGRPPSSVYSKRLSYMSLDAPGSNLVSGVIPTIRPR